MAQSEGRKLLARLATNARQYATVSGKAEALEVERGELYRAARALSPPLTFRQIAEAVGVSEAAVMQKLAKMERNEAKKAS